MSNLTLGKKIALGFGILIMISAGLGGMGTWQMKAAQQGSEMLSAEYVPEMAVSASVRGAANRVMYQMRGYAYTEEEHFFEKANQEMATLDAGLDQARSLAQTATHLKKLSGQIEEITTAKTEYSHLAQKSHDAVAGLNSMRAALDKNAGIYMKEANDFLVSQNLAYDREISAGKTPAEMKERFAKVTIINDIIDLGNDARVKAFKAQALRDPAIMKDAQTNFPKVDAKLAEIRQITRGAANLAQLDKIQSSGNGYNQSIGEFLNDWNELQELSAQRTATGNKVITACRTLQEAAEAATIRISSESSTNLATASTVTLIGLVAALIIGTLLAIFLIRSITGPINRVIAGMQAGSDQVASASTQVSSSAQQLAEGSSEQASSLEETAASLEMMSSGAKESAQNANQASTRANDVKSIAEKGQTAMSGLNTAMDKIKTSSDETAKIIKTIDEIAFQTNLLALNAAVEAARAGDAGKGFAVVAEEVRNLAQRSAEAAKGTADLIDGAKENSDLGVQATADVSAILEDIVGGAVDLSTVIGELSATAEEQARSVNEVNTAVGQMDSVTQSNAAGAEESASAAEEMSAQAGEMKSLVQDLIVIVGGADGGATPPSTGIVSRITKRAPATVVSNVPARRNASADQVIPLDEDCFIDM